MSENLSIERLRRLSEATPEQLAAIDLILGLEKVEVRTGESGNGQQRQIPGMELAEMLGWMDRRFALVVREIRGLKSAGGRARKTGAADGREKVAEREQVVALYRIKQESTRRRKGSFDQTAVSTWRIWFRGEEILLPASVGADYLVFLILNQGKEFTAGALTEAVRKSMPCVGDGKGEMTGEILYGQDGNGNEAENQRGRVGDLKLQDVIWDEHEIAGCLRRLKALTGEILAHEEAGDTSSDGYLGLKVALEEQRELLAANAKEVKGQWVPKEYERSTSQDKADGIRKHFRKLLDEYLRVNCRALFDHLNDRNTLYYGVRNRYQPKPRIRWEVEFKGGKTGTKSSE